MNFFPPRNAMSVYNIVQKGTYYCAKGKHSNWGNFEGLFKEPFRPPEEVCAKGGAATLSQTACSTLLLY